MSINRISNSTLAVAATAASSPFAAPADATVENQLAPPSTSTLASGPKLSDDVVAALNATQAADPVKVLRSQLDQAIATLNDTSGAASDADQLAAYAFVNNTLLNGPARQGQADPNLSYAVDLANSAFAQRVDQLTSYMRARGVSATDGDSPTWFASAASDFRQKLAAFDGLSAADQEIYVGAQAYSRQAARDVFSFDWDKGAIISTVEDYRANLQAQADVMQALQGAMDDPRYAADTRYIGSRTASSSNRLDSQVKLAQAAGDQQTTALLALRDYRGTADWTQRARAYFAEYGSVPASDSQTVAPPPAFVAQPVVETSAAGVAAQRMVDAIRIMNDPTASTDAKFTALDNSRGSGVLSWLANKSAFFKEVNAAQNQYQSAMMAKGYASWAAPNADPTSDARYAIDYFDGLSANAQRSVAYGYGYTDLDRFRSFLTDIAEQAGQFWALQGAAPATDYTGAHGSRTAAEQALDRLTGDQPHDAKSAAALKTLESAAEARQAWLDDLKTAAESSRTPPATAGGAGKSSTDPTPSASDKAHLVGSTLDQVV